MKKILLPFFWLLCFAASAQETILSDAKIKDVTVFLSGAEIHHEVAVRLRAGTNKFVFVGLPAVLNAQSINIMAGDKAKIVSISTEYRSGTSQRRSPQLAGLQDSARYYKLEMEKLNSEISVFEEEKKMVIANNNRIGGKEGVTATELQNAADFYRTRLREINKNLFELNRKVELLRPHGDRLNAAVGRIESYLPTESNEIELVLNAKDAHETTLRLSYVALQAGWKPLYDMRARGVDQPIQFEYKGQIYNYSGLDWNNVKLKLSTSDPSQGMTQPGLAPWRLAFVNDYNEMEQRVQQQVFSNSALSSNTTGSVSRAATEESADIVVSELNVEFEIKEVYTIPSDNKPYVVDINEYQLKADYKYVATPTLDKDAFLLAKVIGWESLNLMEGAANVYFNDSYVGQTYINLRTADDTLSVSLGRDKRVIINRAKKQDFSTRTFLSTTRKETYAWDISVRNSNSMPVTIEVRDQVPLSSHSDIEVTVLDLSKGQLVGDTGIVTWQLTIPPGESRVQTLAYEIKYPKNRRISMQKTRTQQQYQNQQYKK